MTGVDERRHAAGPRPLAAAQLPFRFQSTQRCFCAKGIRAHTLPKPHVVPA